MDALYDRDYSDPIFNLCRVTPERKAAVIQEYDRCHSLGQVCRKYRMGRGTLKKILRNAGRRI